MIEISLLLLCSLFIKHYLVDFVFQTDAMVKGKAIYGNYQGMLHSVFHGLFTFFILAYFGWIAVLLALFDAVTHYHIDYVKMNYGNRDIKNALFWNRLGLDQLMHYIVYLIIVYVFGLYVF